MFWNKYPYTNFHELNLDWILAKMQELHKDWDEFKALNTITFDGEWNITKQYPAWTIVNTNNGTEGYISIQAVPAGVPISNTAYWSSIVNYTTVIADLQNRIIALESGQTLTNRKFWTLSDMANKHVIMIGDSWGTTLQLPQAMMINNWIEKLTPYFGRVYASAHGGYSFNLSGASFITLLNNITVDPGDHIDAIIAIGGANGINDGDVFDFVNACRTLYPDADIVIGANGPVYPESRFWRRQREIEVEAAGSGCIVLKDLWYTTAGMPIGNWTTDHYHPVEASPLAANIVSYLITGEYEHNYNLALDVPIDYTSGDANISQYFKDISYSRYTRQGRDCTFCIRFYKGDNFTAAPDSITLTSGTEYVIGVINIPFAFTAYNNQYQSQTNYFCYILYEDSNYRLIIKCQADSPYALLVLRANTSGTFTKSQVFPEYIFLSLNYKFRMFDFSGLVEYTVNQMSGLSTDNLLGY